MLSTSHNSYSKLLSKNAGSTSPRATLFWGYGFRVGFGVMGVGFVLGCRVQGQGFRVWGLGFRGIC